MKKLILAFFTLGQITNAFAQTILAEEFSYNTGQSGHARGFHPYVPTEPCLKVSLHTALLVSSRMYLFIMD